MFFLLLPKNGHKINLLLGKHDSASSFWLIIAFAKWGFSPGAAQKGPEAFPPPLFAEKDSWEIRTLGWGGSCPRELVKTSRLLPEN